mgnify:CR=1 FL=1
MRLDKYLKVSRLIKRRTVANEACDAGRVVVNDKPAKASLNIKEGDIIEIDIPNLKLNARISDEELARRKEKWQPREPEVTTGYLARYAAMVTSGNRGAVLEVPHK